MDLTERYTKMCEKAPRELWDKVEHYGSIIAWRSFIGIIMPDPDKRKWEGLASVIPETLVLRTWLRERKESIVVLKTNINYGGSDGDKGTPLYRQDQLQEMVFPSKDLGFELKIAEIYSWLDRENNERRIYRWLRSWEQLWLAFVMKEKYNKVWNGKEWVK